MGTSETKSTSRGNRSAKEKKQAHYPNSGSWHVWRQDWLMAVNRHKFSKGDKHAKAVAVVLAFRAWSKSENGHSLGTYTFGNEELALLAGIGGKDAKASREAGSKAVRSLINAGFVEVSARGCNAHGMNSTIQLLFPESERVLSVVRGDGESNHPSDEVRVALDGESNQRMDGEFNHPMDGESNQPRDGESNHPSKWKSVNESVNESPGPGDVGNIVTTVGEEDVLKNEKDQLTYAPLAEDDGWVGAMHEDRGETQAERLARIKAERSSVQRSSVAEKLDDKKGRSAPAEDKQDSPAPALSGSVWDGAPSGDDSAPPF